MLQMHDNVDEGRTDEFGNQEFLVEITGGPKKYYNQRRRRNPEFQEPKPVAQVEIDWYREFVGSLRHARLVARLTQKQLGKELGSDQAAISKFESGLTNPSLRYLVNHAKALGLTIKLSVGNEEDSR